MNIRALATLAGIWVGSLLAAALIGGGWLLLVLLSTEAFVMLMSGLYASAANRPPEGFRAPPSTDYPPPWRPPHDFANPGD